MRKLLTIGMLMAATFSLLPQMAFADGSEPEADVPGDATPSYVRGPRIIHVSRPDISAERVHLRASRDDDEILTPQRHHSRETAVSPPRRYIAPKPQRRVDLPPRKPFSVSPPPPAGRHRAVLSAPPPRIDGPSPIHPTPRFEAKAAAAEKIVPPPPAPAAATSADEQSKDD